MLATSHNAELQTMRAQKAEMMRDYIAVKQQLAI